MAKPNSKATLKSWCKRRLGYPVIEINVDDDQVDDRIDEALQYFYTFQYGGMQRVYLKHKITQADVDRANTNTSETATDGNQVTLEERVWMNKLITHNKSARAIHDAMLND